MEVFHNSVEVPGDPNRRHSNKFPIKATEGETYSCHNRNRPCQESGHLLKIRDLPTSMRIRQEMSVSPCRGVRIFKNRLPLIFHGYSRQQTRRPQTSRKYGKRNYPTSMKDILDILCLTTELNLSRILFNAQKHYLPRSAVTAPK